MTLFDKLLKYQKDFASSPKRNKFFVCSRQGGKSHVAAFIACYECLKRDNQLVLVISTGSRAAESWLEKADKFARAVQVLSDNSITFTKTSSKLEFSNGSKIISLPSGNPASLRGYTAQCVIIDECFFIERPEEVLAAINPTLTRSPDSKLILCSTPGSKNSPFFGILQKAKTDAEWYVQTTTIDDCIKDGLKVDLDQLHQLCQDPNVFAAEFECVFSDSIGQLIDPGLLQWSSGDGKFADYFGGVDWARTSDGTSIAIFGRDRSGVSHLVELVNLHGVEYAKQVAIVSDLFRKWNCRAMYCDNGGLGSPLCERLNKTVSSRIRPFTFTQQSKPQAYENFRNMVFDRKVTFKEDFRNMILEDLALIEQVIQENGKTTYVARRFNGSHADNISAIVLALQAIHDNPVNASAPCCSYTSVFGQRMSRI